MLPAPVQPAPAPPAQATAPTPPASAATPTAPGSEPKRVRTVTIRPDGSDASGRPVAGTTRHRRRAPTRRLLRRRPRAAAPPPPRSGAAACRSNRTSARVPRHAAASAARPIRQLLAVGWHSWCSFRRRRPRPKRMLRSAACKPSSRTSWADRQPIIRRADLGAREPIYRTMVGPFASAQEANKFCASYKSAGGQCVVPRN